MIKKNIISIFVAIIILYLSMASADTLEKIHVFNIPQLDKIVHLCMYFGLMSTIIFENRNTIKNKSQLLIIGLIPLCYGILIEIFQASLTITRSGSIFDVCFNLLGILISIWFWLLIKPLMNKYFK